MNKHIQLIHQLNIELAVEQKILREKQDSYLQAKQRVAQVKFNLDNAVAQIKSQRR